MKATSSTEPSILVLSSSFDSQTQPIGRSRLILVIIDHDGMMALFIQVQMDGYLLFGLMCGVGYKYNAAEMSWLF